MLLLACCGFNTVLQLRYNVSHHVTGVQAPSSETVDGLVYTSRVVLLYILMEASWTSLVCINFKYQSFVVTDDSAVRY